MIRRSIGMLIAFMLVVCISSFAFARGTPQKAFSSKAAVVQVSPSVATVPALVGYDVIQNISHDLNALKETAGSEADTSERRGLSTTVGWRSERDANKTGFNGAPIMKVRLRI
jgi:hypothetical protein